MKARIDIPRLVMTIRHYDTPTLYIYLSEFKRVEQELKERMKDRRLKPLYRRRARSALRGVLKEKHGIEIELKKRPESGRDTGEFESD